MRAIYWYRCNDCGYEVSFAVELRENTVTRCDSCGGYLVYLRTEER